MIPSRSKALFDLLRRNKLLDQSQIESVTKNVALSGSSVHAAIFEKTAIRETHLNRALGKVYKLKTIEPANLAKWVPGKIALRREIAERYNVVPLARKGKTWVLACADPDDASIASDLPAVLKAPIELRVVSDIRLLWMLNKAYDIQGNIRLFVLFSRLETEKEAGKDPLDALPTNEVAKKKMILTADGYVEDDGSYDVEEDLADEASFDALYAGGTAASATEADDIAEAVAVDAEAAEVVGQPEADQPSVPVSGLDALDEIAPVQESEPVPQMEPEPVPETAAPVALTREEAIEALTTADTRAGLANILLGFAQTQFKRAVLLSIDAGHVVGWAGVGEGISDQSVAAIWFPLESDSVFKTVTQTCSQFVGPLAANPIHDRFFQVLGGARPAGAFVMPLLYRGEVSQILWLDNGDGEPAGYDISDLLILAVRVPNALEALVAKAQAEMAG